MQGTRVPSPVREDPTSGGATKLVCCNYWAHVSQLWSPSAYSRCCVTREATTVRSIATWELPPLSHLGRAQVQQRGLSITRNINKFKNNKKVTFSLENVYIKEKSTKKKKALSQPEHLEITTVNTPWSISFYVFSYTYVNISISN